MHHFIVNSNAQSSGDHEVHNTSTGCTFMPKFEHRVDLGVHPSCKEAVSLAKAKMPYKRINGCYYCCQACHTS